MGGGVRKRTAYYAHKNDDGRLQTLAEHTTATASLAASFALPWFKEAAYLAGLLHDAGKAQESFQRKLEGAQVMVEHSGVGAQIAMGKDWPISVKTAVAYCVAGHHAGLPDGGSAVDGSDEATLIGRLKRKPERYDAFTQEVALPERPDALPELDKKAFSFFIRMLFSCLTDADYLDTERFCQPRERGVSADFSAMDARLTAYLAALPRDTPVREERRRLLGQAVSLVRAPEHIFTMNMPTGSGKTLTSFCFALKRLLATGKRRIVYVIPYTTIVEQTASVLEGIFGSGTVLQHHSNYDFENEAEDGCALRRATENWDAPIVVTTNVQFFESMYANRSGRARKLHNVAGSVIVFDEAHIMPLPYFSPCLEAVKELTVRYDCDALFLSATMPDISGKMTELTGYTGGVCDLVPRVDSAVFQRCDIVNLGPVSEEQLLLHRLERRGSALLVVNARKTAKKLFHALSGDGYHLSTYMTPEHRKRVVECIREDLRAGRPITVVSTSLIEAGVDLDFDFVYRELAGLDSVLQCAGRCNREGKKTDACAYAFELAGEEVKNAELKAKAQIARGLLRKRKEGEPLPVKKYFQNLFAYHADEIKRFDFFRSGETTEQEYNGERIPSYPFAAYAADFHFIEGDTVGIVVPNCDEARQLVEELRYGGIRSRRALQKYTASVYRREAEKLLELGCLQRAEECYILANLDYYDTDTGICFDIDQVYQYGR